MKTGFALEIPLHTYPCLKPVREREGRFLIALGARIRSELRAGFSLMSHAGAHFGKR